MNEIKLSKKTIIELTINDIECIATLDNLAIDHFQRSNKKGLLEAFEELKNYNMTTIIQLLGSCIREKKTGKILGYNYFKDYDTLDIINSLMPVLEGLFPDNMPIASSKTEKK